MKYGWLILMCLGTGCASVTPPEGGERDTKAPKILSTTPKNSERKVSGKQLTLTFDEPVTTDQLSEQLVISPETGLGTPRIIERENSLVLAFTRAFAPNTTYLVDFGQSILDVTERNKAASVQLLFTTGETLDSGSVAGNVGNLLTGKPGDGVLVGLYSIVAPDSTGPGVQGALYRTKTATDGSFSFSNVKTGEYRVFAFGDANKNRRYEEPELLAYLPKAIRAERNDTALSLLLAKLDTRAPYIASRKERSGSLLLQYNEGVRAISLRELDGNKPKELTFRREDQRSREVLILGKPVEKARRFLVIAQDSAGNEHTDSVSTRFYADNDATKSIIPSIEQVSYDQKAQWKVSFPVAIESSKSILGVATIKATGSSISEKDQVTSEALLFGKNAHLDSSRSVLSIDLSGSTLLKVSGDILLSLDSTAFSTNNGQTISGRPIRVQRTSEEGRTGAITIKLNTTAKSFLLELLKADNSVVRRYTHSVQASQTALPTISWNELPPSTYRLRVLVDSNGNGRWDGPNRTFDRLPEPVLFHPTELDVRANWEQDLTFTF